MNNIITFNHLITRYYENNSCLTDLSKKATNAAKTALILAKKLQANLLLYNSYINYSVQETCDGPSLIIDDFINEQNGHKKNLNVLIDELARLNEYLEPR